MAFYYHFKDIYDLVEWSCIEAVSYTHLLVHMIVSGVNLAGKSLRSQRHTNIIYQCRIFILLFIGNQNSNYIPVALAGKSGKDVYKRQVLLWFRNYGRRK